MGVKRRQRKHRPAAAPLGWALLRSALFIASLVLLCEPLLVPLELPARIVVGQLAAQAEAQAEARNAPTLAVLKLDRQTFLGEFGGRRPLDRCVLKAHLGRLLDALPELAHLGLDLDLSDTGDAAQDACAVDILGLLKAQPRLSSTLILPVDAQDRRESAAWRQRVRDAGLALADPRVLREFGVVRRHWLNEGACPTLGQALAAARPAASPACFDPARDLDELDGRHHGSERNIAFHALVRGAWVPGLGDDGQLLPLAAQIAALGREPGVKRVLLGAHFDASDEHLTPIGPLAGVEVHAAVALNPGEQPSHVAGFLLDVSLGLAFGFFVHALWGRYFKQLLGHGCVAPTLTGQGLAYLWPLLLLLAWLPLAFGLLPWLSLRVLLGWGTWINPVPMLVGMSVDAFVLGSVAAAVHHAGHGAEPRPDPPRPVWRARLLRALAGLPRAVWWTVLALALMKLAFHWTPFHLLA